MASARTLSRLSTLTLLTALVVLLSLGALVIREMDRLELATRMVEHTRESLSTSNEILQLLTDAETSVRGYAITGDLSLRKTFDEAVLGIEPLLTRLANLVSDDIGQTERVEELRQVIDEKLKHLSRVVETRETLGAESALELIESGTGRDIMERARLLIAEFNATEEALLEERRAVGSSRTRTTRATIVALAVSAPLLLLIGYLLNRRALLQLHQAQRRTQLGEARLRVTLQSCGDALIATDVAGNVVLMNPVAQALTGWREDQALGVPVDQVFRIVNEFTRQTVENPVSRALREGKVVGLANSTVLISKDGREMPIDDSGAPIVDERGEAVGVILVFRDVTSRKLAEQGRERMLRAEAERQAAVDANKAKDEFLALLSHELRSPLAAIRGWLDLISGGFLSQAEVPGALQRIYRNTRLQERLVSDLLDISRIITGKLEVVRSPVDLVEIAETAVTECRPAAEQKGVNLDFERPDTRLLVMGDEHRLVQSITNVITNGIRFTRSGGSVRVALGERDSRARVVVSDAGIGMTQEVLSRLFERFWQAESARMRNQGGLGLGLAIAKHLVEEHGGTIEAASEGAGAGSTFTIEIPLLDPGPMGEPTPAPTSGRETDLSGLSILLVDDEQDSRDAMQIFLEARGAEVRSASSVQEALRAYDRERPSLVVSDIGMPNENGYVLARHVREREAEGETRTPFVALTGYAGEPDREVALEHGFDAHVPKPVDLEELARVIRKLAQKPGLE